MKDISSIVFTILGNRGRPVNNREDNVVYICVFLSLH